MNPINIIARGARRLCGIAPCVLSGLLVLPTHAEVKPQSVGQPEADVSPQAELATFKVLDGFEVNLFASEEDGVPNPLIIRWDERGRLWCVCPLSYPQPVPGEPLKDKIVILEDTNHDGKADKVTVFADGLSMPTGMELAPAKSPKGHSIYVGMGEKLLLMHDLDGDDKVDETEVVLSGFGTGDTHQNINSFIWSPDGALVMHQGLHCYSRVATPWGVKELYGAGFWHYRPLSGKLEPYPTGMPLNAWGTAFTNDGQPIMVAGAAGMYWARPMEVSTSGTSASEDPSARKDKQVGHLQHFLLERFQLPYGGQSIKTEGLTKFCGIDIVGNSHWPDAMQGELITGGFFDNKIYRFKIQDDKEFPSGIETVEQPALITSSSVAFRPVDIRFGPDGALYIADWYNPIIGHYQASFRHPNRDKTHGRIWRVVAKGRGEANKDGRWGEYQALRERVYTLHEPTAQDYIAQMNRATDDSPRVRLEAVVAAAKVQSPDAIKVALKVLDKPMDSYIERALWLAVHATKKQWWPFAHVGVKASAETSPMREARGVVDTRGDDPSLRTQQGASTNQNAGVSAQPVSAKAYTPTSAAEAFRTFVGDMPASHIVFLVKREGSKELRDLAAAMLKENDLPANVRDGLNLALAKDEPNADGLSPDERKRISGIAKDADKLAALAQQAKASIKLRAAALAKLVAVDAADAGRVVARGLNSFTEVDAMRQWLAPVLPVAGANKAMVVALKAAPCSADAAKLVMRVLTSTGRSEPDLTGVLTGILGASSPVPAYSPEFVNALVADVKAKGNAEHGRTIFNSTIVNCTACHSIAKKGGTIGPELDAVGRGVPIELLVEAVVWPNRQIKEGYIATMIKTKDGRTLQGYKVSDANGELQLRDLLTKSVTKFAASEIVSRTDAGSLMPEGLVALMTREELRDLIAYLTTLGR